MSAVLLLLATGCHAAPPQPKTGDSYRWIYVCEAHHPAIDFDPEQMKSIDLILSHNKRMIGPSQWLSEWAVVAPATLSGQGRVFKLDTGSIGGSEGFRWSAPSSQEYEAAVSYSDIVGERGPETVWINMSGAGQDKPTPLTCGPLSMRSSIKKST